MKKFILLVALAITTSFCFSASSPDYDVGDDIVIVHEEGDKIATINIKTLSVEKFSKNYEITITKVSSEAKQYFVAILTKHKESDLSYLYCSKLVYETSYERHQKRKELMNIPTIRTSSSGGMPGNYSMT